MSRTIDYLKKSFTWEQLDIVSLLHRYRYVSLLITALFYFTGPPVAPFYLKLVVALFLFLEARVFIRVYRATLNDFTKKALVMIEFTGLLVVLFFTGGLDSPFLWYAINPILLATTLSPFYFSWAAASAFIAAAIVLQNNVALHPDFSEFLWTERAYLVLIFILITLSAQFTQYLVSSITRQKALINRQLEHLKSLYEAIEVFSHHSDPREVASLFASYSKALTGAIKVIVWCREPGAKKDRDNLIYSVKGPQGILVEEKWYPHIKKLFEDRHNGWKESHVSIAMEGGGQRGALLTVRIKSNSTFFGVLSAYYSELNEAAKKEAVTTLHFLADLCAVTMEKRHLESMADRLQLAEEKDRIARQMHDTVNQNLFGLIHGLNSLDRRYALPPAGREQIDLLQKTARRCLQELRHSIYDLSAQGNGHQSFAEELNMFLADLGRLNEIEVFFNSRGDLDTISTPARSALFRIIREAACNAVRHGDCRVFTVDLETAEEGICLSVADDGCGFDSRTLAAGSLNRGLGLINMKELAAAIGGELEIESRPGKGTAVLCRTGRPLQNTSSLRGEVQGL